MSAIASASYQTQLPRCWMLQLLTKCAIVQTTVAMPASEFIPANCRPIVSNDSVRGIRPTYPAAFCAAQFGGRLDTDLVPSQLEPHGIFHFSLVNILLLF